MHKGPEMDRAVAKAIGYDVAHFDGKKWSVIPWMTGETSVRLDVVKMGWSPSTNIAHCVEAWKHLAEQHGWPCHTASITDPEASCRRILSGFGEPSFP